ncbi:hypothetical protein V8B97DRAFT_2021337 [Scleroderma yunnanense]
MKSTAGWHFKQWTGDDSKGFTYEGNVYLLAIEGYVPKDVIHAFHTFLEFCYLHAMKHYPYLICQFGTPNGLCSSITESKYIKVRLEKLITTQVDFKAHGMLDETCLSHAFEALGITISLHD